jgi:hypothetical protein
MWVMYESSTWAYGTDLQANRQSWKEFICTAQGMNGGTVEDLLGTAVCPHKQAIVEAI